IGQQERQKILHPVAASQASESACIPQTLWTHGSALQACQTKTLRQRNRTHPTPSPEFLSRRRISNPSFASRSLYLPQLQMPYLVRRFRCRRRRLAMNSTACKVERLYRLGGCRPNKSKPNCLPGGRKL